MNTKEQGVISRDEWKRRYAARIMECAGWDERAAMKAAEVGADDYEESERGCGIDVVKLGSQPGVKP